MIGHVVQKTAKPELKEEVLLRMGRGEISACLGYTETSGGSDVFAAKTRAVRDGDDWIINGAKMRSEAHTSELKSLMRISYAVFCLKNNKTKNTSELRSYYSPQL